MWGQNWFDLNWGAISAAQVPIGPWVLLALGFLLGISAIKAKDSRLARIAPLGVVLLVPFIANSAGELIVFSNGTRADADEVNANFSYLETRIDEVGSNFPKWVDSNEKVIGLETGIGAYLRIEGAWYRIPGIEQAGFTPNPLGMYFQTTDCSGTRFSFRGQGGVIPNIQISERGESYVATGAPQNLIIRSTLNEQGSCLVYETSFNLVELAPAPIDLKTAFTPPFSIQ